MRGQWGAASGRLLCALRSMGCGPGVEIMGREAPFAQASAENGHGIGPCGSGCIERRSDGQRNHISVHSRGIVADVDAVPARGIAPECRAIRYLGGLAGPPEGGFRSTTAQDSMLALARVRACARALFWVPRSSRSSSVSGLLGYTRLSRLGRARMRARDGNNICRHGGFLRPALASRMPDVL